MVTLPEPQVGTVTQYLAAHFPPKTDRAPTLVPGTHTVTFREWIVPTLGQRSRDPIQLADGTMWWTGQYGSLIGRLNPRTGEMREFKLAPDVRPHSIAADASGNIWYTGNANGTIGRLNPATGESTVYKMPDPAARDPHTPVFDKNGTLFFTLQQSNMVGRLTPATGEIKLVTMPTPRALPYPASSSTHKASCGSATTAPTNWRASIQARWKCASTCCRIRRRGSGVSPSPATTWSGT